MPTHFPGPPIARQGGTLGAAQNPIANLINNPFLLNILAQQGFSDKPGPGPLGVIGRAGIAAQQQERQSGLDALQKEFIESQILRNRSLAEAGGNPSAKNVQSQFITQDGKLGFLRRDGTLEITETDVKDSFAIQTLPDGSQIGVNRSNPSEQVPVITSEQATEATINKQQSKAQAEATTDLPKATARAGEALQKIDQLENHEGLPGAVGVKSITSGFGAFDSPVGGSKEADFVALVEQLSGGVFLEAFQELKGGGHITEIEGIKAEQAIARIRDRNQSEKGYKQALSDLRNIIHTGLERKEKAARGDFSPSQAPRRRFNPETGKIE